MPLLCSSMASGKLHYSIFRNLRAVTVYINGERRAVLYYTHFWRIRDGSVQGAFLPPLLIIFKEQN